MSNHTITLKDIPDGWPQMIGEISRREGQAVRGGPGNTIEVKCLRTNRWNRLMLPGGGGSFLTFNDRDAMLELIGKPSAQSA